MTDADPVENNAPLYDTHAHFFSNDTQRYPLNTSNAREGEENLRRRIATDPATPERIFKRWDESGVTGGCGVQYNTVYKSDNSYVLDVAERHAGRIAPVVMLDATAPDAPSTLDEFVRERGVVGLRLFGRAEADGSLPWLDSPAALRTWEVADRHCLAMVLMFVPAQAAPVALPTIAALAKRFAATTLSLDHFGWVGSDPAQLIPPSLLTLREHRNVFYKLTTINFHLLERAKIDSAQFVRRLVDVFGADHMMWGSDVGNTLDDYASMARRARASTTLLTSAERQQFLHDTGAKLFARRTDSSARSRACPLQRRCRSSTSWLPMRPFEGKFPTPRFASIASESWCDAVRCRWIIGSRPQKSWTLTEKIEYGSARQKFRQQADWHRLVFGHLSSVRRCARSNIEVQRCKRGRGQE